MNIETNIPAGGPDQAGKSKGPDGEGRGSQMGAGAGGLGEWDQIEAGESMPDKGQECQI